MIQKFLDGKKKYSALIITLAAAVIPILVQDPEAQKTVLDLVPSLAAVITGVFYIITQGKIDDDKVKAQAANGQAATVQAAQATAEQAAKVAETVTSAIQTPPAEPEVEFDVKSFHQTVLDTVKSIYTEENPATIFYRARDLGDSTICRSLKQAKQYWDYLISLGYSADEWFKEMDAKKKGQCGRSIEYAIWLQGFQTVLHQQADLLQLMNTGIDWKAKLTPTNCTLIHVAAQAREMLIANSRSP